jgi:hypothetical protein
MGITIIVDEDLLAAAERATRIQDRARLVEEGLRSLCRSTVPAGFDFEATLRAAEALPDLADEDFEKLGREINAPLPPAW